jgi:hypothetical protein
MRAYLVSYLRFVGFSVVALVVAACAKLAPPETAMGRPEPLFGEPPEAGQMAASPPILMSEDERIAALETQIDTLDAEIAHLREALDVLGPLPEQDRMFIPVARAEILSDEIAVDPEYEANTKLARLYATPPVLTQARTLFYEAELGSFSSNAAAEAGWKRLAAGNRMAGLQPRYSAVGAETRLVAGPLASEAAVNALCVELSALAGPCRVAAPIRAY